MLCEQPLVIWVNSPPFVERGSFAYLENHWPGGVVYAILGELRRERSDMGWDMISAERTRIEIRRSISIEGFSGDILARYPNSVHLIGGMSGATGRALACIVRSAPADRVAVFTERPGAYGPLLKRLAAHLAIPIKYAWLVRHYRRRVGLLLPLGEAGLKSFQRFGWPAGAAAPFMYCPPVLDSLSSVLHEQDGPVRFLYVGRLSRYTKGTDVLLKAVGLLRGDWALTLVGGHGDLVEEVNEWASAKPRVEVLGRATPDEVRAVMSRHDVCVVPSRFDGWNVVVNESLYAGRGVIATDQAVSDEMLRSSGAGLVVRARSARALAAAMQQVIDDPRIARVWNARAVDYAQLIMPASVGRYLMDALLTLDLSSRSSLPRVPWLNRPPASYPVGPDE